MTLLPHPSGGFVHDGDPGEPGTHLPRVSVTPLEASILTLLATGKRCMEIGTGLGVSTTALALTADVVYTYDVDEWVWDVVWPQLEVALLNVITCTTWTTLPRNIDFAFIDGNHETTDVLYDIAACEERLRSGGMLVVHDAKYENVQRALGPAPWHHIPTEHGLAVKVIR